MAVGKVVANHPCQTSGPAPLASERAVSPFAIWIDAPVVADGNLVTSPHPDAVLRFNEAMLSFLKR